jgi:hypothetical protein
MRGTHGMQCTFLANRGMENRNLHTNHNLVGDPPPEEAVLFDACRSFLLSFDGPSAPAKANWSRHVIISLC